MAAFAVYEGNESMETTIRIWDISESEELITLHGHTQGIEDLSFSADGSIIASYGSDDTVRIWGMPR
jgi:COMPASS component SWD3